jgi:hypothetical protein
MPDLHKSVLRPFRRFVMCLLHDAVLKPLSMLLRGLMNLLTHDVPVLKCCSARASPDMDSHCEGKKITERAFVFIYLVATLHYQNHHLFFSL